MTKVFRALRGKIIVGVGVMLIVMKFFLPELTAVAFDASQVEQMLDSGQIFYYEPQEESRIRSGVFFTKIDDGVDSDEVIENGLEVNTTYTMHLVMRAESYADLEDVTLLVPLVEEPIEVSDTSATSPSSVIFILDGQLRGDNEEAGTRIKYVQKQSLWSFPDRAFMTLRYVPGTARCYVMTEQGEERETLLPDDEIGLIGARISSYDERYALGPVDGSCEVRLTVQTSEGKGGMSTGNAIAIIAVGVIAFFVVFAIGVVAVNYSDDSKSNPDKDIEH